MLNSSTLLSKTIAFIRFPLIVGVVFGHSKFAQVEKNYYPFFDFISYILSNIVAYMTVPLFFIISGFLFFYSLDEFTKEIYWNKLKKRMCTIFIPYMIWNFLIIVFMFCVQSFNANALFGFKEPFVEFGVSDWIALFWNTNPISVERYEYMPVNYPLWFLRDLMVAIIFSPLVYFVVKKTGKYIVFLCVLIVIGADYISKFIGENSLFTIVFFLLGSYLGIYKINFINKLKDKTVWFAIAYSLFVVVEFYFRSELWVRYWHLAGIIVGILLAISLCAHCIERGVWKVNKFLAGSSFFVYAFHAIPLGFAISFILEWLHPHSEILLILLYVAIPTTVICLGLVGYWLFRAYMPKFTTIITGGR